MVLPRRSRRRRSLAHCRLPRGLLTATLVGAVACGAASPRGSSLTLVTDSEPGQRLTIRGRVAGETGRPVAGARLHVYQTDASGRYTPAKPMDEPNARLAGWLQTDKDGGFELHTIRPGGYPQAVKIGDRERKIPAHIHVDIAAEGFMDRRAQVVFADDPLLSEQHWKDWATDHGNPVVTVVAAKSGQVAELSLTLRSAE
jgi:protocatechuate 3,4-dioxygenase beta subunit